MTVSVLEASKILNLTKQTVVNKIKRGELKGSKNESGQWIVDIDDSEVPNEDQFRYQEVPNNGEEAPNKDQFRHQRVPNSDQEVPNQDYDPIENKERRPRRENDDALLENNKFLQLTTASNQELVARLTRSIEDKKSSESKAWLTSSIIFGSLSIIAISILLFYFTNQTSQIKEESKTLRNEMNSEHQTTVKSLGTKYQESLELMETRYQNRYQEDQVRYQKAEKDYQDRYQELSNDYQKKETLLQNQIDLLKVQNKELMGLLKTSKSGNLE
jgi:hypothetical protein